MENITAILYFCKVFNQSKFLIVIAGPTAVGKTEIAIQLARHFNTEIISADSRQIFREMEIGTAKPNSSELAEIPHHFVNSHSICDSFNAVVLAGGSGLYIDALCHGMDDFPEIDPQIREDLNKKLATEGITILQNQLLELDAEYYWKVDLNNPQRLIRALEVCIGTGKKYSTLRQNSTIQRPFGIIKIGLRLERAILYERIDRRMDKMIANGLFEEAQNLFSLRHLNALQTVGYSEIFDFLEEKTDKEEAIRLLKRNSRRYAKRQLTWFNRDKEIHWFEPTQLQEIINLINLMTNEQLSITNSTLQP
jgi:tRNA dimethylallyltransferase